MKNTIGNAITMTLFGESHGEMIGAVLDGLAPGVKIDRDFIEAKLALRRPAGKISTARVEPDSFQIVSGVMGDYTTGTPLTILIPNTNTKSGDYQAFNDLPRPGHADYTAECKYHGYQDYRGGGHFSGRITAAIVAAGAVLQCALEQKGVYIGTHVQRIKQIKDIDITCVDDLILLSKKQFPVLNSDAETEMIKLIEAAANAGDSVGGVLQTAVYGLPAGVGEPWFDSIESVLSHALFSIPAVKAVEFGIGCAFADLNGSKANDPFVVKDGKVVTITNNNGGINGGITNGMPVLFSTTIKPTPSIYIEQDTVRLSTMQSEKLQIKGRHDPAIIHRARAVVDAMTAFVLADMLTLRYGTDYLAKR